MISVSSLHVVDCGHVPAVQSANQRRRHSGAVRRAGPQPAGPGQGQARRADEPGPSRPPGRGWAAAAGRLDPQALRRRRWAGRWRRGGLAAGAAPMEVIDARPIGTAWLLDALWAKLEIGTSIKRIADGRRFTTAVERVLFALVCNRAI